jgi:hypothetical protein
VRFRNVGGSVGDPWSEAEGGFTELSGAHTRCLGQFKVGDLQPWMAQHLTPGTSYRLDAVRPPVGLAALSAAAKVASQSEPSWQPLGRVAM